MRQFEIKKLVWIQWIIIPVLLFCVTEYVYRMYFKESDINWYQSKLPGMDKDQPTILFLGTSRTAAAVQENIFSGKLETSGVTCEVLNMGIGQATQAIHLHALQDRIAANPHALESTIVFLETCEGLPTFYYPRELYWDNLRSESMAWRWQLYLDTITVRDPAFLLSADLDLENRLKLLTRAWTKDFLILGKREIVGLQWRSKLRQVIEKVINMPDLPLSPEASHDLQEVGGVRADAEGVSAMLDFELNMLEALRAFEDEFPPFEMSPTGSLIQFILDNGGTIYCYDVPIHSQKKELYCKANMVRGRRAFSTFLEERDIPILQPEFQYKDDDLPDRNHLLASRSNEFTKKLFSAWQHHIEKRQLSKGFHGQKIHPDTPKK